MARTEFRINVPVQLETEDGDSFPTEMGATLAHELQEAFRAHLERIADKLGYQGIVAIFDSVTVESVAEQAAA